MTHLPGIVSSQSNYVDPDDALVFRHGFNGTSGSSPSSTDETGKSITFFGIPEIRTSSPSPAEGSGYIYSASGQSGFTLNSLTDDLNFGSEKFTIEFDIYVSGEIGNAFLIFLEISSNPGTGQVGPHVVYRNESASGFEIEYRWFQFPGVISINSGALGFGIWHKVKCGYDGSEMVLIVNDVIKGTSSTVRTLQAGQQDLRLTVTNGNSNFKSVDYLKIEKSVF